MGRACCVLGCPSGSNVPSHQFPKDPVLARKWKNMIYSKKLEHLTDEQLNKRAVCHRHFADDDYLVTFRVRKLKRGVAPSLNLPNGPQTNNWERSMIQKEPKPELKKLDIDTSIPIKPEIVIKSELSIMDTPEITNLMSEENNIKTNSCLSKSLLKKEVEQSDSEIEAFESYCRLRTLRRKRVKPTPERLALLQRKKQAEQYAKTTTIQKLLSLLTPAQRVSVQTKIQKSKYSPKVYIKIYHDIAKQKALEQL